jgi:nitrogen fixation NifU-like protein
VGRVQKPLAWAGERGVISRFSTLGGLTAATGLRTDTIHARLMHSFYKEIVLDHFQRLRNRGELKGAHVEEHLNNPLCGDEVTVYAVFDGDKVSDVKFGGRGCSIFQASASMMTERLLGKTRQEAVREIKCFKATMVGEEEFPEMEDLAALKGVIQYPSRLKRATLAWTAFQRGLESEK